jgi:hypothetical protein
MNTHTVRLQPAIFIACLTLAAGASAQESQLGSDFRREGDALRKDCTFSFKSVGGCAYTLFTDHPLHISAGSIAPQNGVGFGPAFVAHWTPNESWRLSWDVDAIASTNRSWRAGAYMTAIWGRHRRIVVNPGGTAKTGGSKVAVQEYPVFHLLVQSISLNTLDYFGLGPETSDTARSYYGMRETITGVNAVWPVISQWHVSLYGEANGRFVDLRPSAGRSSPSIEQLYTPDTAPGLDRQPAFAQLGEGVRIRPEFARGFIRLNYSLSLQEYLAAGDSRFSFQRFTADLSHQIPLYRRTRRLIPNDSNGPDDCSADPSGKPCPAASRDMEGSIGLRFLLNESFTAAGHVVPFYFQPTLGGSDINGNPALPSYQDYRFRAPNNLLLRASIEHSIYGPLGVTAMLDEGKVALTHSDLDFSHLLHSYTVGLTLRAGGFPMVYLLFSWGGHEGTHTTGALNSSLLGGSARPSLY